MKSYIVKIYPHKYMDRVHQKHFKADHLAHEVSRVINLMLSSHPRIRYNDNSTNEGYEFEILNPNTAFTRKVTNQIKCVFPEVSFREAWQEFPILNQLP